jgi:tRNA 2-selenouridine synthase
VTAKTYTVDDLAGFDVIIDARSPAEHALDHIPGSINCPVLDDEERRIVGTTYVQVSAFEARKIGGAMVARNIARHLDERFRGFDAKWRPLVYCWRGGMRSGSFVNVLRLVGWDAQQLKGGYKGWRHHVVDRLPVLADALQWRVLCGPTGSAKTRVLQHLALLGEQVVDLEALAVHRGSVLGEVPGQPQPSQKGFETQLFDVLSRLDPSRPVWIEAESRRIGRITVPEALTEAMFRSPLVEIVAPVAPRVDFLLRDYAWLVESPEALTSRLAALKGLVANAELAEWQAWAAGGQLVPLLSALLARHYDPLYARSLGRSWVQRATARQVMADDLSAEGIARLAERVAREG